MPKGVTPWYQLPAPQAKIAAAPSLQPTSYLPTYDDSRNPQGVGRPRGPIKVAFTARLPLDLVEQIRIRAEDQRSSLSIFAEKALRDALAPKPAPALAESEVRSINTGLKTKPKRVVQEPK